VTTISMATISTAPSAMVAANSDPPSCSPVIAIPDPTMAPITIIRPINPLAEPTCRAGTRSGTYPWKGPCAKFEETWIKK